MRIPFSLGTLSIPDEYMTNADAIISQQSIENILFNSSELTRDIMTNVSWNTSVVALSLLPYTDLVDVLITKGTFEALTKDILEQPRWSVEHLLMTIVLKAEQGGAFVPSLTWLTRGLPKACSYAHTLLIAVCLEWILSQDCYTAQLAEHSYFEFGPFVVRYKEAVHSIRATAFSVWKRFSEYAYRKEHPFRANTLLINSDEDVFGEALRILLLPHQYGTYIKEVYPAETPGVPPVVSKVVAREDSAFQFLVNKENTRYFSLPVLAALASAGLTREELDVPNKEKVNWMPTEWLEQLPAECKDALFFPLRVKGSSYVLSWVLKELTVPTIRELHYSRELVVASPSSPERFINAPESTKAIIVFWLGLPASYLKKETVFAWIDSMHEYPFQVRGTAEQLTEYIAKGHRRGIMNTLWLQLPVSPKDKICPGRDFSSVARMLIAGIPLRNIPLIHFPPETDMASFEKFCSRHSDSDDSSRGTRRLLSVLYNTLVGGVLIDLPINKGDGQ